jgi:hypothetical protein
MESPATVMKDEKDAGHAPVANSMDLVIEAYKKDIDRTLLRESLKLTVEERLDNLAQLQRFLEEMREAGRRAS